MKYGLIVFKNTKNIGDDIQSYAVKRFLPKVDYYIEREELNEFISDNNEPVKAIISGWFNHSKLSFPPSPFIEPYFISAHFTDELKSRKPIYFTEYFMSYLRKYEPIGLRDDLVKEYLDQNNISNYFSGCATLTIEKFKNINKTDNICLVDLDYFTTENIKNKFDNVITKTHNVDENYTTLSYEKRFEYVENLLKTYQSSKCVITTRLHCALPCLALGVPVILVYRESDKDVYNRLSKYTDFLNYVSDENFRDNYENIINNIQPNKNDYQIYSKKITHNIEKFVFSPNENSNELNSKLYENYFVKQKKNMIQIFSQKLEDMTAISDERYKLLKENEYELEKVKMINQALKMENDLCRANCEKISKDFYLTNSQLYEVINSPTYKFSLKLEPIFKIFKDIKHWFRR